MLLLETEGVAAFCAREMYVLALDVMMMWVITMVAVAMFVFLANAVFVLAAAVVKDMEQLFVRKQSQRTEESTAIDGRKRTLKIAQRKGEVELRQCAPNEYAYGCGPYAMVLQMLCNVFCHHAKVCRIQ